MKEHGEIREYRPAVVGYRERKIHKLEEMLKFFSYELRVNFSNIALTNWIFFNKELEIQQAYLQHEGGTAV